MQNKYSHRKKWLIANLKEKPGKRPLGSSTARRKLTQTSTLIVYCPRPIQGRETQPSQHPAHVRREFNPLASAGAGSGDHPPDTGCRQARASSRLRSQDRYFNTRRSGEQTAKATLVTVPAPGPSAAPAQGAAEERGYLQLGPFQDLQALSHHEQ